MSMVEFVLCAASVLFLSRLHEKTKQAAKDNQTPSLTPAPRTPPVAQPELQFEYPASNGQNEASAPTESPDALDMSLDSKLSPIPLRQPGMFTADVNDGRSPSAKSDSAAELRPRGRRLPAPSAQRFNSNPAQMSAISDETATALNTLWRAIEEKNWDLALKCLITAKVGGGKILERTWSVVFAGCVSKQSIDPLLPLTSIDKVAQAIDPILAVVPSAVYNILMKAYVRYSATEKCFELHSKMLNAGVIPSAFTYSNLLEAHIANNNLDEAVALLRDMENDEYAFRGMPNPVHYTTVLKGLAQAWRIEEAVALFKTIPHPDVITYSTLIKAHCDAGGLDEAVELLKSMVNAGVIPDDIVFNTLFSTCSRYKNVELGRELFSRMVKLGIVPSTTTMEHLVRLYYKTSRPDLAAELLEQVAWLNGPKTSPPKSYVDLLRVTYRRGNTQEAWRMYEAMSSYRCVEGDVTWESLVNSESWQSSRFGY